MKRLLLGAALAALASLAFAQAPAPADAPMTSAEADASAIVACMDKGKDSQSQQTCVLGTALMKAIGALGNVHAAPAAPPMVQVQAAPPPTFGQNLAGLLGAFFGPVKDTVIALAPAVAQVYSARTNAHTQEVIAGYNRDTQIATVNGFTTLGTNGINGTRDTAGLGFTAVSNVASQIPQPGASYTVSGHGVLNTGPGMVTYSPVTGSYNPVNPAPTIVACTTGATDAGCSRP